jgi:hypothetical protein
MLEPARLGGSCNTFVVSAPKVLELLHIDPGLVAIYMPHLPFAWEPLRMLPKKLIEEVNRCSTLRPSGRTRRMQIGTPTNWVSLSIDGVIGELRWRQFRAK